MTPVDQQSKGLSGAAHSELRPFQQQLIVPTLMFVGLLVAVVSSLGTPLIPTIAGTYHVTLSTAQWMLTAALLTGALATPVMGKLADGPSQRRVIIVTLFIVFIGCLLAAVSETFVLLVVGRALQGVGLGLLPVNMAVARRNLEPEKAARAIATLSITTAIGVGLGYPLTGLIAEVWSFHAAYWFGVIVVACALVIAAGVLPSAIDAPSFPFDFLGAALLSMSVVGISVVLSEGDRWGWTSGRSLAIVAASLILLAAWIPHELRNSDPLVELRHLGVRSVLAADTAGFLISVAMYLFLPIIVVFVQIPAVSGYGFGASIVVSGLVLVPLSCTTFLASRFLTVYERRFGSRSMIPLGSLVFAGAAIFFAVEHSALWEAFVTTAIAGIGLGFTFAAMPGFIIRSVPRRETGSATGFYQVLRNIGLSVGSAFGVAVLSSYTRAGQSLPTESGYRAVLSISAGLCVATAVLGLSLIRPDASKEEQVSKREHDKVDLIMEEEAELAGTGVMLTNEHERSE